MIVFFSLRRRRCCFVVFVLLTKINFTLCLPTFRTASFCAYFLALMRCIHSSSVKQCGSHGFPARSHGAIALLLCNNVVPSTCRGPVSPRAPLALQLAPNNLSDRCLRNYSCCGSEGMVARSPWRRSPLCVAARPFFCVACAPPPLCLSRERTKGIPRKSCS